jgi:IS5 family transposase
LIPGAQLGASSAGAGTAIPALNPTKIGAQLERLHNDARYKGHNAPLSHRVKVYTSGQKRCMTPAIKREMKHRAAIEPVIGHIKSEHHRAATISPTSKAMLSMPSSPPPATISACCSTG